MVERNEVHVDVEGRIVSDAALSTQDSATR
jgi:hypothetical protein